MARHLHLLCEFLDIKRLFFFFYIMVLEMHTYVHALIYTLAHKKPIQPLDSSPLIAQYEQWNNNLYERPSPGSY